MTQLWTDLRFAARTLARRPLYLAAGVLTLALAIGANSLIFSVVQSTLLAPLPYGEPDRLVTIWSQWVSFPQTSVSEAEYALYRDQVGAFDGVAMIAQGQVTLGGAGEPERVDLLGATRNLLSVLGVEPYRGRGFTAEEAVAGDGVAMIGYELWQRRYGGDEGLIGSTVIVDGEARQVVGILPPGLVLPQELSAGRRAEIWWPLTDPPPFSELPPNGGPHGYLAIARLAESATVESARAELAALNRRFTESGAYTEQFQFRTLVVPVAEEVTGRVAPALRLLTAAVGLLLLIACANLASLGLSHAFRRRRELAVRTALGAAGRHLGRLLIAESLLIALAGAAAGLLLAAQGLDVLQAMAADQVPRLAGAELDGRVVAFTAIVAVGAALLSGLLPALWAARRPAQQGLRGGAAGPSAGSRARSLAVAFQVALAVVLVTASGLMLRTVRGLLDVDAGFDREGVAAFGVYLPPAHYPEDGDVTAFYRRAVESVSTVPGVTAAGAVRLLPLATDMGDWGITVEGYQPAPEEQPAAEWQAASPGYFEAMGIDLLEGRPITASDDAGAPAVMVVNRAFAERFWPGRSALGRRVRLGRDPEDGRPWAEVVGVVADVRHGGLTAEPKIAFYLPQEQFPLSTGFASRSMSLVVRTSEAAPAVLSAARGAVRELDSRLALGELRTLDEVVDRSLGASRLAANLLAAFAFLALALAAVGIYGVTSALAAQRRRELGIRIALGARRRQAEGLLLAQGAGTVGLGLVAGIGASLLLTRLLSSLLYGVGPRDPVTFLAAPLVIGAVALLAAWLPAHRASRLDPRTVLQEG